MGSFHLLKFLYTTSHLVLATRMAFNKKTVKKKEKKRTRAVEDVEKLIGTLVHWWECKMVQQLWKIVC